MKKILIIMSLAMCVLTMACSNKNHAENQSIDTYINTDEMRKVLYQSNVELLEETDVAINTYEETLYRGTDFPTELISLLEKSLYQSPAMASKELDMDNAYFNTLLSLGSSQYEMEMNDLYKAFPELNDGTEKYTDKYEIYKILGESDLCLDMFQLPTDIENDKFLFCYDSGGSFGNCSVVLKERSDDGWKTLYEFQTQNNGYGKVILFEDTFYYIHLQYNYNLKFYDSIDVHKIDYNADDKNILIKYVPEEFFWKNVYTNESEETELNEYIEKLKEVLEENAFLDMGKENQSIFVLLGDEIETQDFKMQEDMVIADIANAGMPVYIQRFVFEPSNTYTLLSLNVEMKVYDSKRNEYKELECLGKDTAIVGEQQLLQMWFPKINDKTYIFQVYHLADYNYLLKVLLIEENEVKEIRQDLLLPRKEFVLEEGKENFY